MVRILGGGYMCDEGMKLGRGWVRVHACEVKVPTISVGILSHSVSKQLYFIKGLLIAYHLAD